MGIHQREPDGPTASVVKLVSLLAKLEGAVGCPGHLEVLPFLGLARAEVDGTFSRAVVDFVEVEFPDVESGVADVDRMLSYLIAGSASLIETLRLEAARRMIRIAIGELER